MGERLLGTVAVATGLPQDLIDDELTRLLQRAGFSRETVTMDQLRTILAEYVQDVLLQLQQDFESASHLRSYAQEAPPDSQS